MSNEQKGGNTWRKQVDDSGRFKRKDTDFRDWVKSGEQFEPASGRYHLYISYACPWAHRALIARSLKGLEDCISVDVVHPFLGEGGWRFDGDFEGSTGDSLYGAERLGELYDRSIGGHYEGVITVPVLWDRQTEQIVNNESADLLRILNHSFNDFAQQPQLDLYPESLQQDIDAVNAWTYPWVNNGVYRSGFAKTQDAYEEAVAEVFKGLDRAESRLQGAEWLVGNQLTEADIRLFTTLIRFDAVYYSHFKCNQRRIRDYPALQAFTERVYALPGVAATVDMQQIKYHYYASHGDINPTRIVPVGPVMPFLGEP